MPSFFVSNCFHWIGYHMVNYLLEHGYSVTGYERSLTDKQEHLAMMVGRNDLFSLLEGTSSQEKYTHAILFNKHSLDSWCPEAEKVFHLSREESRDDKEMVGVRIPLLFGEWMPMNETGMYMEGQFISFASETFKNEAVYIQDFISSLMLCLMASLLPGQLTIKPKSSQSLEKDDQVVFLREQRAIDEQLQTVLAHYKRFENFYTM